MNQHKRNTDSMHQAMREKRDLAIKRVLSILETLPDQKPITFSAVAKLSCVSKAWLHRHAEIRKRIDELRTKNNLSS